MSGGRFNYENNQLAFEIYNGKAYPSYGIGDEEYLEEIRDVRKLNSFEDKMISEIVFDVLCLINSFDYYKSGDILYEDYLEDVKFFKNKWLKLNKKFIKETIRREVTGLAEELTKAFCIDEE